MRQHRCGPPAVSHSSRIPRPYTHRAAIGIAGTAPTDTSRWLRNLRRGLVTSRRPVPKRGARSIRVRLQRVRLVCVRSARGASAAHGVRTISSGDRSGPTRSPRRRSRLLRHDPQRRQTTRDSRGDCDWRRRIRARAEYSRRSSCGAPRLDLLGSAFSGSEAPAVVNVQCSMFNVSCTIEH